jgi:DNA-binding HxlR family transcriptional regulator
LPTFALIMEEENNIAFRSFCPIATGLDVLGDKWTLLILRDMIFGHKKLFNEFKESPEKVPSKMLSNRLRKLENIGFISRAKGKINKKSVYYLLEDKGLETLPLMVELMLFTTEFYYDHLGDTYTLDVQTKMKTDKVKYIKDISAKYMQFQQSLVF